LPAKPFLQAGQDRTGSRLPGGRLACLAMSAHLTDAADGGLPLTGERTVPGLAVENYWFRRHEVAYRWCADKYPGQDVLEAGCGEGYGADLIAGTARRVVAVDYDAATVAHVAARYPRVQVVAANLAAIPMPDASVDVVVNFQVIEHLWDQPQFITECLRLLRPGGLLLMSTPNRITFTPDSDTPVNPFHTRELTEMDARHGGSIIDAQIARAVADAPWPADLLADVAAVRCEDFEIVRERSDQGTGSEADRRDIDDSLDLLAIAVRP
jgi:SAM-dependent methyltransferase